MGAGHLAAGPADVGVALGAGRHEGHALAHPETGHALELEPGVLGVDPDLGRHFEEPAGGEAHEGDVGLHPGPETQALLGQLVGVGRWHPDVEHPEVLVGARQHGAAAVEVGGVGVGHDHPRPVPVAPPHPGRRLVLDPQVAPGPDGDGGGPRGPGGLTDPDRGRGDR